MRPSAERPRRACAGFTLLELMLTLAIVGLALVPMLSVREGAQNRAFRTVHMLAALDHAQTELAERVLERLARDEEVHAKDQFTSDGTYTYELLVERFDLASGRPESDEDEDQAGQFTDEFMSRFGDAGLPEEEAEDDPYLVRHYRLAVTYPDASEKGSATLVLEGFWPLVEAREDDVGLLGGGQ